MSTTKAPARRVVIFRGISGAGKTTHVRALCAERDRGRPERGEPEAHAVVTADAVFTGSDGVYRFEPARLPEAHRWCLREFTERVTASPAASPVDLLIVDNTSCTVAEVAPYAALALAYGWELEVITIDCDPALAHRRNVHGVSRTTIERMAATLREETRRMPPWWPHRAIAAGGGER